MQASLGERGVGPAGRQGGKTRLEPCLLRTFQLLRFWPVLQVGT